MADISRIAPSSEIAKTPVHEWAYPLHESAERHLDHYKERILRDVTPRLLMLMQEDGRDFVLKTVFHEITQAPFGGRHRTVELKLVALTFLAHWEDAERGEYVYHRSIDMDFHVAEKRVNGELRLFRRFVWINTAGRQLEPGRFAWLRIQ